MIASIADTSFQAIGPNSVSYLPGLICQLSTRFIPSPTLSSKGGEGEHPGGSRCHSRLQWRTLLPLLLWRRGLGRGGKFFPPHALSFHLATLFSRILNPTE